MELRVERLVGGGGGRESRAHVRSCMAGLCAAVFWGSEDFFEF